MSDKPRVSVLMPVYNTPSGYLKEAIESILDQTYENFEFIIVDGSNDDECENIILSYKDQRIKYFRQSGKGLVNALNEGIGHCNGEYIARMDADDIAITDRIEKQLKYLLDRDLDICGSYVKVIDESGELCNEVQYPCKHDNIINALIYTHPIPHPTWFVKKLLYNQFSYNSDSIQAEDHELLIRCLSHIKSGNIPEYLLKYRIHNESASLLNLKTLEWITIKNRFNAIFKYNLLPYWKIIYLLKPFLSFLFPSRLKLFILKNLKSK